MLLMAAIVASSIAIATMIASTYRQAKNLDNFIMASLAADSGLERSLAIIAIGRVDKTLAQSVTAIPINPADDKAVLKDADGKPVSQFTTTGAEYSASMTIPTLRQGESVNIDLFTPPVTIPPTPRPTKIQLTSQGTDGGSLEISWVVIESNGNTAVTGRKYVTITQLKTAPGPVTDLDGVTYESGSEIRVSGTPLGYRVRIRAWRGDFDSLEITAQDPFGAVADLQSQISITSTGQAGQSQSLKRATILWRPPASPLFNYILFTEDKIIPEPGS